MVRRKGVLTTGQVAQICQVAPRTVSKWFDTGQLKGYRVPGSKDRRIPVEDLMRFMRAHGLPLDALDTGATRILVVDANVEFAASLAKALRRDKSYAIETAESAFGAGLLAARFSPHVILVDLSCPDVRRSEFCATARYQEQLAGVSVIAMSSSPLDREDLRRLGYDACLTKPFDAEDVLRAIDEIFAHAP